ncbi:MAG: hypothetical protein JRG91_04095, partial [Deltaproteobacteria bacterium]|nr:hypothetical protein [Deltaproteobacteria bacterium]
MTTMNARSALRTFLVATIALAASCDSGDRPGGLARTPDGSGPVVVFDLFHRPLPKVPIPTDVAARPDPDSPTGMRINVSLVADTRLESWIRGKIDTLDGWGGFTPITVPFECTDDRDGICLDLDNVMERQHDRVADSGEYANEWPFQNDAIYLINVDPDSPALGKAMPLDVGQGNYPKYLDRKGYYYPNDPRWDAPTLMYENENELRGEDLDMDGTLDFDEDIDGDGVLDDTEDLDGDGRYDDGTEDLDGDGHLDVLEVDVDGDTVLDVLEVDADGDTTPDRDAEDVDGDGHLDIDEDIDGDGEQDRTEDLNDNGAFDDGEDIDGDGNFDDVDEDINRDGLLNVGEDLDGDGYLDTGEDVDHDRNIDVDEDTDGDGHLDIDEDVDNDGTFDVQEDLDHDGEWDVDEDVDGDGWLDDIDEDLDGDGTFDTEPGTGEDVDGDGWLDVNEDENGNGELDDLPLDTNFDGHVGRANVWCSAAMYRAGGCHCRSGHECPPGLDPDSAEDMETLSWLLDPEWHTVPFYEFETNTLVMRPMVSLSPRTTYAVVLTDRLVGEGGRPVLSPFPYINHVDQTAALEPLEGILSDDPHTFGGLTIDDVRFAWTFTTQSTWHDLK